MSQEQQAIEIEQPTTSIVQIPNPQVTVAALQQEAQWLLEFAEARVILNDGDVKGATDDIIIIATATKLLEAKRKEYLRPLDDQKQLINDTFKLVSEPLGQANKINGDKFMAFKAEQERIRQEQEEINRLRIEAAQKEQELKGEISEPVNLVEVAPEPTKQIYTNMGAVGTRDNWKYEVFDFALLPDEYKIEDSTMLNATAKKHHDQKQVPGVRFYNEPVITRSANKGG